MYDFITQRIKTNSLKFQAYLENRAKKILAMSIEHVRLAIMNVENDKLYEKINFFGGKETRQRVIFQVGEHMAEHLGQLIVYARMIGVILPWSNK